MKMETFEMERMQSTYENIVEFDLSESGVHPVTLRELHEMGLDLDDFYNTPLGYSQSNGTPELREEISQYYADTTIEHIEVTNGTSEANYLVCNSLLEQGDEFVSLVPNYMQLYCLGKSWGGRFVPFSLRYEHNWEPDWNEFDRAMARNPKLVYITNPNNPTGSVLSLQSMERIVRTVEEAGSYLIADEVYQGAELEGKITPSFWGMSDRVIITNGLSKAYGIPGVRIGWIVGSPQIVADCWRRHDTLTIGPGKLSDQIARIAVRPDNRKKLFARTAQIIGSNLDIFRKWVESFKGFLEYKEPKAGAIVFLKYNGDVPSVAMAEQIRKNQDVLIVPGAHLGMEGFIRMNLGLPEQKFRQALNRVKAEIDTIRAGLNL